MWHSNRTLAMNASSLSLNASDSLANKTLIVTTILVSPGGPGGSWGGRMGVLWGSCGALGEPGGAYGQQNPNSQHHAGELLALGVLGGSWGGLKEVLGVLWGSWGSYGGPLGVLWGVRGVWGLLWPTKPQ